jgi:hypothetical protein
MRCTVWNGRTLDIPTGAAFRSCGSGGSRDAVGFDVRRASRPPALPQGRGALPLWERRQPRCSWFRCAKGIAPSGAPTGARRSAFVGAAEAAMLLVSMCEEHCAFRRSAGEASRIRFGGSGGSRDACGYDVRGASRLPALPQGRGVLPLWERRQPRCSWFRCAKGIAPSGAPTGAPRSAFVGAAGAAMPGR